MPARAARDSGAARIAASWASARRALRGGCRRAVRSQGEFNKAIASQTALGRVGLPDDIGGIVATLLAPQSRWINAQRIEASGGMLV